MLNKKSGSDFLYVMTILLCLLTMFVHFSDSILSDYFIHYSGHPTHASFEENEPIDEVWWQIVVDLDQNSIRVYKNGMLEKTYPCSGGKDKTPSPTGDFLIISKESWGEGFGGVWMGLNVPWGTFGIHGTKQPWVIGKKNVSKGCIRMRTADAKELADMVPLQTPVRIQQKSRPFFTLYTGDTGSEIWNSQVILYKLGYYNGEFDGKFGEQTKEAILAFQSDFGLKETGSLNKNTYDTILKNRNAMQSFS